MKTRKGYEVYPLTSARKFHFYCLKYCPKKQVLDVGSSLTIQADLDWDVLKDCTRGVIARCDAMHLHFAHDEEGSVYQYVVKGGAEEIEYFDFTDWKEEGAERKLRERTEAPLERYDSPMHRIIMVRMSDGYQGFYICVDHMTVDTQSLILLFRDVAGLCASKPYDGVDRPKKMSSCIKQLKKDLAYETGSRAYGKGRQFFQEPIASSGPTFTNIYGPEKLSDERETTRNSKLKVTTNTSDNAEADITSFHLEGDPSSRLLDFCEKYGTFMTCLPLIDLRTYLQKKNNRDNVPTTTTISKRVTLSEKRCGGSRIHCLPFKTIMPRESVFIEGLLRIRDAQNQYLRRTDYNPLKYFSYRHDYYRPKDGRTCRPLSLTYQSLVMKCDGPGLDKLGDIKYKAACYSSGVAVHTLYLTASHRAEDDGLDPGFEYQTGMATPERLEYIYYCLYRIIFRGVKDSERAVGEIVETV